VEDDTNTKRFGVDENNVVQSATGWSKFYALTNSHSFFKTYTDLGLDVKGSVDNNVASNGKLQIGNAVFTITDFNDFQTNDTENIFALNTSQIHIRVNKTTYATSGDFEAYLQANDVSFYYELETPIETEVLSKGFVQASSQSTVYVDDILSEVAIYSSGLTTSSDISEISKLVKINSDGSQTEFDTNTVTLTSNQISAITGASDGDLFYIEYFYTGEYARGTTTVEFYNSLEDIQVSATQAKTGSNLKPDFDETNIGFLFPQNNTAEILYIVLQMPHDRVPGTPIWPHVHCRLSGSGQPVMKMDYKWYNASDYTVPTGFTTYTMDNNTATWSTGTLSTMIFGDAEISGVDKTDSSMMIIKLYRDDNVYVGDLLVDEFDIHYYKER
jgi:hypothetical protein